LDQFVIEAAWQPVTGCRLVVAQKLFQISSMLQPAPAISPPANSAPWGETSMHMALLRPATIALGIYAAMLAADRSEAAMAPTECADALVAAMGAGGVTATFAGATANGEAVTITGLSVNQANGRTLAIDSLTFANPTKREPGGFTSDKMEFTGATAALRDNTLKALSGEVEMTVIPSADEVKARKRITPFSRAVVSGITATDNETSEAAPVSIDSVEFLLGDLSKGVPNSLKLSVTGITVDAQRLAVLPIPMALVENPDAPGNMRLDVVLDTVYESEKDALTIRAITLSAPKIGSLTISAAVSGLPLSTLAGEKRNETAMAAKLDSATLRFENGGLVERMLDEQAKISGETRQQYLEKLLPKLPELLGERLGKSEFQQKLAAAAESFLRDPKSITMESRPSEPVPVFIIGLAAFQILFGVPVDLSEVSDVEIKTNQ
jgi:hypothetical protein